MEKEEEGKKMLRNKIEGVKPFNEFWFKSCYYHQLVAGLSCFGITHGDFLVNSMVFIERDFLLDTTGILCEKEFEKFSDILAAAAT